MANATAANEEVAPELLHDLHDSHQATRVNSRETGSAVGTARETSHLEDNVKADKHRVEIALTDQTNLLPFKRVIAVFGGLSLCALVSCLDSTIVATALPSISAAFNAGSVSSWVPSAYLLTSTAFQPLCEYLILLHSFFLSRLLLFRWPFQ